MSRKKKEINLEKKQESQKNKVVPTPIPEQEAFYAAQELNKVNIRFNQWLYYLQDVIDLVWANRVEVPAKTAEDFEASFKKNVNPISEKLDTMQDDIETFVNNFLEKHDSPRRTSTR